MTQLDPFSRDVVAQEADRERRLETVHRFGLPIVIVGAGPVGMAAAAELIVRGEKPLVLEAGGSVGAAVSEWGHVRVFSPWRFNIDPAARQLLETSDWQAPAAEQLPTGREIVERYLEPLTEVEPLRDRIRLNTKVIGIARHGYDKLKTAGREDAPFELVLQTLEGEERLLARAVIDASGTWRAPNWLGASGLPAPGELELKELVAYGIPDVLGAMRSRYAGRKVLVVGSGHSAFNVLLDLTDLRKEAPATELTWAIRRGEVGQMFGGGDADALPGRAELGSRALAMVRTGQVTLVTGFATMRLQATATGVLARSASEVIGPFDEIIASTGFRPDLSLTGELRLELDPLVEAPTALAPLIDPNVHSCGSVPPHGVEELSHPERGYYAVGMKSYGRAPTFLMMTGYEQVRSIASELTGDLEGARRVELVLPETGVCSSQPAAARLAGQSLTVLPAAGDAQCCTPLAAEPGTQASACCSENVTLGDACCPSKLASAGSSTDGSGECCA